MLSASHFLAVIVVFFTAIRWERTRADENQLHKIAYLQNKNATPADPHASSASLGKGKALVIYRLSSEEDCQQESAAPSSFGGFDLHWKARSPCGF